MTNDVIAKNIDLNPEYNYYFCLLGPRFQKIIDDLSDKLSERHGKKFVPIYVTEGSPDEKQTNYIQLAFDVSKPQHRFYAEELNIAFSNSTYISQLIDELIIKQGDVYLMSFTSAFLSNKALDLKVIGPNPSAAAKYDNKAFQAKLFQELDLNNLITNTFASFNDLKASEINYPVYLSAAYSSSGVESAIINSERDLDNFYENLRDINKSNGFFLSRIIDFIKAPNVSMFILPNGEIREIAVTDQILNGNSHVGNIYPSSINEQQKEQCLQMTKAIGQLMYKDGFIGLFGCDFLIGQEGTVYVVDLNPRRQGGYLLNYLSAKSDILDIELDIADGTYKSIGDIGGPNYCWINCKLNCKKQPIIKGSLTVRTVADPFTNIGTCYVKTFYKKGDTDANSKSLGVYIATDYDRDRLINTAKVNTEKIVRAITA